MAGCRHQSQRNALPANCQNKQETKVVFAFPQFCQSLNILGDSVQIDQIHLRRQFSVTLTYSCPNLVRAKSEELIWRPFFGEIQFRLGTSSEK